MKFLKVGNFRTTRSGLIATCVETEHGGYWSFSVLRRGRQAIYVYNKNGEAPGLESDLWLVD